MDFEDCNEVIYFCLRDLYHNSNFDKSTPIKVNDWSKFIEYMDIGIVCNNADYLRPSLYTIVDEKKWVLAKIKYGL